MYMDVAWIYVGTRICMRKWILEEDTWYVAV